MRSETTAQGTILRPWQQRLGRIDWHYKLIIALVVISYAVYLPKHLSIDSWNAQNMYAQFDQMQSGHWEAIWGEARFSCFSSGRFSRGVLFLAFALARKASWLVAPWVNWVAIAFMCLAGCKMWTLIRDYFKDSENSHFTLYICCLLSICNPFFTDWMQYIECQLYHPLALWLSVSAASVLQKDLGKSRIKQWCVACVLLTLSAGFYQISLQYFVLLSVSFSFMALGQVKSGLNAVEEFAKRIFSALSVYFVAAVVQLCVILSMHSHRVQTKSLEEILDKLAVAQGKLWLMTPYTKNPASILLVVVALLLGMRVIVRIAYSGDSYGNIAMGCGIAVIGFLGYYMSLFLPLVVSELWFPQRSLVGFWGIPLILAMAGDSVEQNRMRFSHMRSDRLLCGLCGALLIANVYSCIRFGTDLYRVNAIDRMRGQLIYNEIFNYETASGITIKQVAFFQDDAVIYVYPDVVNSYENNLAAWSASWNYLSILETVSGRRFQQCDYPEALFAEHYDDKTNWDEFSAEQVWFENETAYVVVY